MSMESKERFNDKKVIHPIILKIFSNDETRVVEEIKKPDEIRFLLEGAWLTPERVVGRFKERGFTEEEAHEYIDALPVQQKEPIVIRITEKQRGIADYLIRQAAENI